MTPDQLARSGSESGQQRAIFAWAAMADVRCKYPELLWMFAIPNGKLRSIIDGANLKAEGVKAGVPDIFLPVKRAHYGGLFIELKRVSVGRVSDVQNTWIAALVRLGYAAKVCYGWQDARNQLEIYLNWKQNEQSTGKYTNG